MHHLFAARTEREMLNNYSVDNPEANIAGERAARRGHHDFATTLAHKPVIDSICVGVPAGDSARGVDAVSNNVGVWNWRGERSEVARRIAGETASR